VSGVAIDLTTIADLAEKEARLITAPARRRQRTCDWCATVLGAVPLDPATRAAHDRAQHAQRLKTRTRAADRLLRASARRGEPMTEIAHETLPLSTMRPDLLDVSSIRLVALKEIRIGQRHRTVFGDLAALASSIKDLGLLQPIVVTPELELISDRRRMEAVSALGRDTIEAYVVGRCR
jgi:hypothetical protein